MKKSMQVAEHLLFFLHTNSHLKMHFGRHKTCDAFFDNIFAIIQCAPKCSDIFILPPS